MLRVAASAALAAALAVPAPAPAAQDADTLRGRVVQGTDSSAVEGQEVVLHRVGSGGGTVVDSTVTGPRGEFAFPLPDRADGGDDGEAPVYLATARHGGVLYMGPAVPGDAPEPPGEYRIEVYPPERASTTSGLTLRSRTLVLTRAGEGMRVMDVVSARGRPGRTLVGPPAGREGTGAAGDSAAGARAGRAAWWSVAVPAAARDVRVLPGAVDASEVTFVPGEARISAAIPPAGRRVVLGYGIPAGSPLEFVLRHPVELVEVVAGRGAGEIRVPGAREAEPLEVEGDRLARYRLEGAEEGDTVRVVPAGTGAGGRRTAGWIAVGAGVLLAAAALWTWRRRRPSGARRQDAAGGGGDRP